MILAEVMKPYSVEQIRMLEERMNAYETWVFVLVLLVAVLVLIVVMQRLTISKLKSLELFKSKLNSKDANLSSNQNLSNNREISIPDIHTITQTPIHSAMTVQGKDLPDPGMVFKYTVPLNKNKMIAIGQREGSVVTRSTDVLDHHLTIDINAVDVSNLDILSYSLEFRREGKVLIQLPGSRDFREMGVKEKFYISKTLTFEGETCLETLGTNNPLRFRIGSRIGVDGKFKAGYFEFHLFTKDVFEKTINGNKRVEKHFYLKLFKIFPGYDTAGQTKEGLVPMLARFGL
ncbi:hypothetical protein EHQ68_07235 [Leptospira congkakensis]|uniref:Uncharacterized protein n=1 Tax=Leptospira congkakensis TaxID=2484932 RepID=A0A4Z1A8B3_9LEPT|nr:hypothetical protein [Leptospira congkakensis]TGL87599.1 hypothetical protein EHQ69_15925 [Leptospira congkakensis]TGL89786.1 hypothetical protein EHQ68_07235 [Leptospira congkakensis]TGL95749.1 hypothetical protein EHQ70_11595 [Leptospira congkakensis]